MKKIIAAFDGLQFSKSTLDYTTHLAKQMHAQVIGVFLDDRLYHSYHFEALIDAEGGVSDKRLLTLNEKDKEKRDAAVQIFEQACQQADLHYSVHRDKDIALQELLHESIYADLLIINKTETFMHYEQDPPTDFMRDLLTDVQCPVLIVPKTYHPLDRVLLLYDGEPSSVHAIKMFSYLMPALKHLKTEVLTIKSPNQSLHVPDSKLMKEFAKRHFPNAEYTILRGHAEEQIVSQLQNKKEHTLVVLGAYQRSRVSRWFKRSMADYLMQHTHQTLFIAHNK